jgi:hypothetical protein
MTQFTITKKGQEIEFDSAFSELEVAKYYLQEHLSYNTFAQDLTSKKNLSERQIAWVHYLATEHLQQELNKETQEGEYKPLIEKMYAKLNEKSRKFHLHLPADVSISTVNRGPNTGSLYVFYEGIYIGKITPEGILQSTKATEDVKNLLLDANENLLKLAQLYGHETGNCAVCGRTLSDPISIQTGIGPICAKKLQ